MLPRVPRRRKSEYSCIKRCTRSFGGAFSFFDREVVAMKPLMDKQKSSCVVMKQNQAGHPLVSVVVPVYNVEEYLEDMLRSVLR